MAGYGDLTWERVWRARVSQNRRELEAAAGRGLTAAATLDGLIGARIGASLAALAGAGMKRVRCRERDVPANGCRGERTKIVIGSRPNPGIGWRSARCGAAGKDLDNDHAPAAARARQAMISRGVRIGGVMSGRWIDRRHWGGHQFLARAILVLQLALASSP